MFSFFKRKNRSNEDGVSISKKKQLSEKQKVHVKSVMEKTGWEHDFALSKMKAAKATYGIKFKDYDAFDMFKFAEDSLEQEYKKVLEKKEKRKAEREACINAIVTERKLKRADAINLLEEIKRNYKMTNKEFLKYKFYEINEDQYALKYEELQNDKERKRRKKERKQLKNERLIRTVMESTGWEYEYAKKTMDKSEELTGAEYKDYVAYKFWDLSDEEQKTYFTKGNANYLRKKYNTNKENIAYFTNKNQFNEVFGECLGRDWVYNRKTSIEEFTNKFNNSKIIYKPLSSSCGAGVTVFDVNDNNINDVYSHLSELPIGVVEGYLIQHPAVSKYSRNAVNTVRVVTVLDNDEVNLLYAAFRMAGGDSVVDNFHSGGVIAIVDTNTGEVVTDAFDLTGNVYEQHPTTGEKVKGFKLPYWNEITDLIKKAGKVVDGVGYVGWDIAITGTGPVLIEGNTAPAPIVLQLPYARDRQGMRHMVEKYLD